MSVKVRLIHDHTADDWHQWVFLGETEYRDLAGRVRKGAYRRWLVVICNNAECEGRAIIYEGCITGPVEERFPCPPIGREDESDG